MTIDLHENIHIDIPILISSLLDPQRPKILNKGKNSAQDCLVDDKNLKKIKFVLLVMSAYIFHL